MSLHEHYEELLSAALDGELSEAEQAELNEHLKTCEACRALYAAFTGLSGQIEMEEPPAELHDRVMRRIDLSAAVMKRQRTLKRLRPIMSLAAGLVVIVGTVLVLGNGMRGAKSAAPAAVNSPAEQNMMMTATANGFAAESEDGDPMLESSLFSVAKGTDDGLNFELPQATGAPSTDDVRDKNPAPTVGASAPSNEPTETYEGTGREEPQTESPTYGAVPDTVTHAVIETPEADGEARIDDPAKLSMLLDWLTIVSRTAEPNPRLGTEHPAARVIRLYDNEIEVLRIELSDDGLLRADEGAWLALTPQQTESLNALLEDLIG